MSLVGAALLPHAPLLAPAIGRDHREVLKRTIQTVSAIAEELYAGQPELIVVLTPHGTIVRESFFCNVAEEYVCSLEHFGDLTSTFRVNGHPAFAYMLKRLAERNHFPITLGTTNTPDYALTIPLSFLRHSLDRARVLAVSPSELSIGTHKAFGDILGNALATSKLRSVIVGSVELSHCVNTLSPEGQAPEGRTYDSQVVKAISDGTLESITALDDRLVAGARTCSHTILAMFRGALADRRLRPSHVSYEAPFGVGELAASFPVL